MKKKIYIADDEKNIRDIISLFLTSEGFVVEDFETGDALIEAFIRTPCDLVVLDIMMDGTDGLMICSKLRQHCNVPIIIVSAKDSELDRIAGITMGSDDYMVKPFSPMELVVRVKGIFRRIAFERGDTDVTTLTLGDMTLDLEKRICKYATKTLDLTPTEFAIMVYLFRHQDRAVSRTELLKSVWEFDVDVDTRATDNAIKRLRKKLSATNIRITAVWGFGFQLELEERRD